MLEQVEALVEVRLHWEMEEDHRVRLPPQKSMPVEARSRLVRLVGARTPMFGIIPVN